MSKHADLINLSRAPTSSNGHSLAPQPSPPHHAAAQVTIEQASQAEPAEPSHEEAHTNGATAPRIPAKVSPVPLPPHVLAAMAASSQATSASPSGDDDGIKIENTELPVNGLAEQHEQATPLAISPPKSTMPVQIVETKQAPPVQASNPQEFADVPGSESMQFVERMMQNLKRASSS